MRSRKGIGSIIATVLLLVVAVFSIAAFQNWFGLFSSQVYIGAETQSKGSSLVEIEALVGENLYFSNSLDENVTIREVLLNGNSCNISLNISSGMNIIPLSDCIDTEKSINDVVVVTNKNIYSKKYYFDKRDYFESSLLTNQNCSFNGSLYEHNQTYTFYSEQNPLGVCSDFSQNRTCNNGILNGSSSFEFNSCNNSCLLSNGTSVAHNWSGTFYASDLHSSVCTPQTRTCNNGVLNGTYNYESCEIKPVSGALSIAYFYTFNWPTVNCGAGGSYGNINLGTTMTANEVQYYDGNSWRHLQNVVSARTVDAIYYVTGQSSVRTVYMQRPQHWKLVCADDTSSRYTLVFPENATHFRFVQN